MRSLYDQWKSLAVSHTTDDAVIETLFQEIQVAYFAPSRYYHGISHLEALLDLSAEYEEHLSDKEVVNFSIFYHDLVYQPTKSDNEERSADIARSRLSRINVPESKLHTVIDFIHATKSHQVKPSPYEMDVKWFLDFDLAVLGAEEEIYLEYAKNIRKEFKIFPDLLYKPGRRKVLQHFLKMDFIFKTDEFRHRFEKQAKNNLQKELELLK